MFRAQSAHHQEVNDANFTYAASGIVTLCKWPSCATAKEGLLSPALAVAQDGHLQRVEIPEAAYVQFASLTILMMSGLRLKHVVEFNLM